MRPALLPTAVVLALAAGVAAPVPGAGQTAEDVRAACVAAGGAAEPCADLAVGGRALMGHLGLAAGLGSEVPGSGSTLGHRLGSTPRLAAAVRIGGVAAGLPDVLAPSAGAGPAAQTSFFVPVVEGGVTVGLLDGFFVMPTVGGVLSLDLFARGGAILLPGGEGFRGAVSSFSFGGRVGLLRESFTLPGVTVSVSRRLIGAAELGDASLGDPASLAVDAAVTSVRAIVAKDLLGFGFLAGMGWDDHAADASLVVPDGAVGSVALQTTFDGRRRSVFFGASRTFVVIQLSAEGGWMGGFGPVVGYERAPFDPSGGSAFGSFALRLTI